MAPTTTSLGSLVIGSADPDKLAAWYREAFAPGTEPGVVVDLAHGRLIFDRRDDLAAATLEPGRVLVNLHVQDFDATEAHLRELGVTWIRTRSSIPAGTLATVADPDGNYVQIVQVDQTHRPG
ncbi:MAG: VOC family protein [Mycobacteriales bacterium]